jgi:hypothetical protein
MACGPSKVTKMARMIIEWVPQVSLWTTIGMQVGDDASKVRVEKVAALQAATFAKVG